MRMYTRWFIIFISIFSFSIKLNAVPASPYPFKITQPDGTEITIRLRGDEFFNYKTTLDGYPLIANEKGILTYAYQDINGNLVTTNIKANELKKRTSTELQFIKTLTPNIDLTKQSILKRIQRSKAVVSGSVQKKVYPLTGSPKSLVILVNFSDKSFVTSTPQISFTNLLNQNGYSANGGTGSARDYFHDNSMGVFNPQFDVVGPYTLDNTMAYYGTNAGGTKGNDTNPQQMVIDACKKASEAGVDFSQYDTDNDGMVDNVFIYYAGYNEAEGGPANTVWPHRWTLANYNTTFNGKIVYDYACTSELKGNSGSNMCGIGTFCHEFGHVLGLDDLYNTDGDYSYSTLSYWDIMDSGPYLNSGRTPPAYSAYERFYLNWLTPTELKKPQNAILETLTTSNNAYIITQNGNSNLDGVNPSPVEFFLLENRQKTGWDSYLPGHGMLVTRVYYNASTWGNNTPNNNAATMGIDIMEADGIASDATLAGDPFPGTSAVTSYSPVLRSGTNINKPLTYITETNDVIKFRFMGGGNLPTITKNGVLSAFKTVQGTPTDAKTINIGGVNLKSDINLTFKVSKHFEMKKETDPETAWSKTITLARNPIDSTVASTRILIRYNPTEPSFTEIHKDTLLLQSTGADNETVPMTGTSTRPVYVVPPVATAPTDITIASFVANWNTVFDATGYYLTAYSLSNGESTLTEGFNKGLTAPANWTITASAISSSTIYSGDSIPSIEFKNSGEYIQTEQYMLPVTSLSFYIRSLAGINGYLQVDAWNGTSWNKVDSIPITSSLNTTNSYFFNTNKNYNQFRLTYTKVAGYIVVDDVKVGFSQKLEYLARDKWLTATSDTLINLASNRDYYYKVKASDKTLNTDKSIKYENITNFSNLIHLNTFQDKSKAKSLIAVVDSIYVDNSGTVNVYIPATNVSVNVYNTIGQLITSIKNPSSNKVEIHGLARNHIYIIQAGDRVTKVIL
ncbi:M6 family metalloprotease domain protein [Paludibacter propionicigenes WB4]|uniref:M6 family metalloprotease domain protein n=1 Tax=Paludibacter propionicigenes (strain DSM 17365 / JCM 13257 / WB4) TaxID=694427 RepID=E4T2Z9_PALPW|nr:M6 family metalloprotease domain-containing protein [Paludibacter propionicigenes]ADQ79093.1 M6 family metalloprotease domain protein [Paludibacter propionicigenes WB4]